MPVQKGKQKRRPRSRYRRPGGALPLDESGDVSSSSPQGTSTVTKTKRFHFPLWVNVAFGVFILLAGVYFFFVTPPKGTSATFRILILGLYVAMAVLYLGKAYRQYRSKDPRR